MKDEIKEKLLKEIKKYPKKQNYESGLSGYCLKVIDSTDKLNRFEKKSFSEILSRWVLEERLDQHEETSRLYQNELNLLQEQIKAKDEEELKFLFEMNSKYKLFNGNVFMNDMVKDRIDKIKKDLKENEE